MFIGWMEEGKEGQRDKGWRNGMGRYSDRRSHRMMGG